jgi:hypothetical protein
MIKRIGLFLLGLLIASTPMAADNSIKMAYNFTTVSQTVVFNSTMQSGGTLQLSAQIADGGGRNPGDPITLKLVFYNSSNQVVNTVQQAYTMTLGAAAATYSVTATNCGNSCATVAYVSVQFYGKDGGYWAGNYGPMITSPSLKFNGGSNILYNPEFGTYSGNAFAQGWYSSAGWQNCAFYSGSATCVIDNGASVNGGNYSATGGTTSGTSGGYTAAPAAPSLCCGGSSASFSADPANTTKVTTFVNRTSADSKVHIEQIGNFNTITVEQTGTRNNYMKYAGNGDSNTITTTQSGTASTQTNYIDLELTGNSNTVNLTQTSTGGGKGIFASVSNNSNILTVQQKDAGNHYAEINLSGGSKTVDLLQQGSAAHMAKITLSGQPVGLNLSQSGSTQQFYSINYNCATAGGCQAISVTQGQ